MDQVDEKGVAALRENGYLGQAFAAQARCKRSSFELLAEFRSFEAECLE